MTDVSKARAASNRLMNGLTVEIRKVGDDIIYGYEGLSFSGCTIWAYSTKLNQGYVTCSNSEEEVYVTIYDDMFKYTKFDTVPDYTQQIYKKFIESYHDSVENTLIPREYQGNYHRVNINEKDLALVFVCGSNYIIIRNPDEIRYDVVYVNGNYRIKGKDNIHGARVGFYQAQSGHRYMCFDGTLYIRLE